MAVITFSQEFGSGGMEIAKRVAEELGYFFVDKQIIGDLLAQYGLVGFQRVYDSAPAFWESFDSQKMEQRRVTIEMMNRTILALAQRDRVVIVGRGGYLVLAGYADVINIRLQAAFESRVARIMKAQRLDDRVLAESLVRENDSKRKQFMEFAYDGHRERTADFTIVLDTDAIPEERAISLIVTAARDREGAVGLPGKRVSSITTDPVLKHVIEELRSA